MGQLQVKKLGKDADRTHYIRHLLADIKALEIMLERELFEKGTIRIGAEQEFCLVNEHWEPSDKAVEVLQELNEDYFTHELTKYNLELNLDPLELEGNCFSQMHEALDSFMDQAALAAAKHNNKIVLTGILPTITTKFLELDYMTPAKRYSLLNEAINDIRRDDIELHIRGVDELNLHHNNILYEGCNTSFQAHLQIEADTFAENYNWAQAISGPILSVCTNSPMLMGRELWEETRIALFAQSVDTRASSFALNERESRVGFGSDWVSGSVADFYKEMIAGFRSLLTADFEEDSLSLLEKGTMPKLRALALHNGTIYKWNRPCFGTAKGIAHIRIENRYLPSGPTTEDEIANMMFWVGVMIGRPKEYDNIHLKMDFKDVKNNFFNAARCGMAAQLYWDGKLISSKELLLDTFLPMAYRGLYSVGVAPKDAERYLSVIENRLHSVNGSRWMVGAYRKLRKTHKTREALKIMTATMHERCDKKYTIDTWRLPRGDEYKTPKTSKKASDVMSTKIITALENDSLELVINLMKWNKIHHMPVLNHEGDLVGILSWTDAEQYLMDPVSQKATLSTLMQKKVVTTKPETPVSEVRSLMTKNRINSLPIVDNNKLVGILTSNDLDLHERK